MGFTCALDGEYTISIIEIDGIDNLWLEDLKTGDKTDLKKVNYTFSYTTDENPERFVLHFSPLSVNENQTDHFSIYTWSSFVSVKTHDHQNGEVSVYNLLGQKIASENLTDGQCKVYVNKQGYYLVKVITEGKVITKKVFVD